MKTKKKLSAKIVLFLFVFTNFFSLLNPTVVFAGWESTDFEGVYTDNPVATGVVLTVQFKGFLPINYGKTSSDPEWDPFVAKHKPNDKYAIHAQLYETSDNSNVLVCSADKRMVTPSMPEGFCANLHKVCTPGFVEGSDSSQVNSTMSPSDSCYITQAGIWMNNFKPILQKEWDDLLEDNGLDPEKVNEILEGCGTNPVCIENTIENLIASGNYYEDVEDNDSLNFDKPLTPGSLSDLINSNRNNQPELGPINSAENDPNGVLSKIPGPTVDVTFVSDGPQPGSKMKASAIPGFFNNASDPKNLYFTWYLKRKDCDLSDDINNKNRSCDLDGNDRITENDWKIAATRIIVSKSYDKTSTNYNAFPEGINSETSGYKAIPEINKDGWRKGFLRNDDGDTYPDNDENAPNCYVQAPKSGRTYELRKTTSTFENDCPIGYHRSCVADRTANCDVAEEDSNPPVAINNPEITTYNACAVVSEYNPDDVDASGNKIDDTGATCKIKEIENFKTSMRCANEGELPLCVKDDDSSNILLKDASTRLFAVIAGATSNAKLCSAVAKKDPDNSNFFLPNTEPLVASIVPGDDKCEKIQDALVNGKKDEFGNVIADGNPKLEPKCGFERGVNVCQHLFPTFPKANVSINGKEIDMKNEITGDGKFTLKEKEFWGADPTRASTSGKGNDEAVVVGLGVDKFEWTFSYGDQVGVVVEGEGETATDHADSTEKQRRWAFSKGKCTILEEMEDSSNEINRGFYLDGSKGILTADLSKVDLNDCLEENLLEPPMENIYSLAVQLNATPENPINDPTGDGDVLNIVSTATNTQNQDGLMYKWSVQKSLSGSSAPIDTTPWKDITSELVKGLSFSESELIGLNKKDLAMNLNIKDPANIGSAMQQPYNGVFYLRIRVEIMGAKVDGEQDAKGEIVVRVKQQENEMRVFPVTATASGMLNLDKERSGASLERCSEIGVKTACPVTKNELIGLTIPKTTNSGNSPFSWTINGNAIDCASSISTECASGNNLFFPVLGNVGEAIDVVAKGIDANNEPIEVGKHFVIVSPGLRIETADGNAWPKLLGYYKDLNSEGSCLLGGSGCYADVSSVVMETSEEAIVMLSTAGGTGLEWAIDGQIIPEYRDQSQIKFPVTKKVGESYNIGLSTYLSPGNTAQLNNIRRALYKNWGITPEEMIEENQSANIQLDVVASAGEKVTTAKQGFFGASLITHLPEQLMFLFRIVITSAAMLMLAGLLFAFMPETLLRKE